MNNGMYVESKIIPKDGALNYEFNDNGTHYEIVSFNKKAENGIVDFILTNINEPITIVLVGSSQKTYRVSSDDKTAMKAASNLSVILTDINRLLNEMRLSQAKLDYIYKKQETLKAESDSN